MTAPSPLKIMDVTLKEGGFRLHHRLVPEQVGDMAQELQRAGIKFAQISHGCGVGAFKAGLPGLTHDKDLLVAGKLAAGDLKICIYVHPSLAAIPELPPLLNYFHMARVGVNFNEPHSASEHIELLRKHEKTVFGEILRGHSGSPTDVAKAGKDLKKQGCEVLYLTDTFGSMDGEAVRSYLAELKTETDLPVGFQGRNHLGRAVSNSLNAIEAGAEWVDASLMGLGEGPGITNLEILTHLLQARGLATDLDLRELTLAAKNFALSIFGAPGVANLTDLLSAKYKIDFYPKEIFQALADILDSPLETVFSGLRQQNSDLVQLKEHHIRKFLSSQQLDYDVVMEFLRTGKIPHLEGSD
jgi:4-hydroxy 2-oxovalerate aldolase